MAQRGTRVTAILAALSLLVGCAQAEDPDALATPTQAEDVDMQERPDPAAALPEPGTPPPTELVIEDLVVGDGDEATAGSRVSVHYVGVAWSTREEFDASWERGPFSFGLGAQEVIAGWDQGVEGMRVGGRRRLVIPPDLAYGDRGAGGGVIAPGETLVFVVDLLAVE